MRLGAWCDLETEQDARRRLASQSAGPPPVDPDAEPGPGLFIPGPRETMLYPNGLAFSVEESAVLADGLRPRLHAERGFAMSARAEPWAFVTQAGLRSDVLTTVLPDDAEESGEEHHWD